MLFNSLTFLVFLAFVLAAYWSLPGWTARKILLLAASYLFYGVWNPPFLLLLIFSTAVDFYAARWIARRESVGLRIAGLCVSLATNLGLLGFFKYGNFLVENFESAAALYGIVYQAPVLDVVLPVGISFYTFQTLSYTIDVFRRKIEPTSSMLDFALYVTFFPQLVAGPIVRAVEFLPQCLKEKKFELQLFIWGLFLITFGLFQKSVLADTLLSGPADTVFRVGGPPLSALDAWIGALAFSGQILFDFAGYSTVAIGSALCLGFRLPENFRFPYAAIGFSDFWRRWHITLSTWLRDYLYIPLGGNRGGWLRTVNNLGITMFLGGLWHGASWNFVVWGLLHGWLLMIEHALKWAFPHCRWCATLLGRVALTLVTFLLVCVAWVFFRAEDFPTAFAILAAMTGLSTPGVEVLPTREILQVLLVVSLTLGFHFQLRDRSAEDFFAAMPRWLFALIWGIIGFILIINQGESNAFIYFQF